MSTNVSESDDARAGAERTEEIAAPKTRRRGRGTRRRRLGAGVAVLAVAAAGGVLAVGDPFGGGSEPKKAATTGTSLGTVREGPLSAQIDQSGTLAYQARADGTPYSAINQAGGIYTRLPSAGDEIRCGRTFYRVGDDPVLLLCGGTPAYRDLSVGHEGKDVEELNKNLVDLGYADESQIDDDPDHFGWETADALVELQDDRGMEETGTLKLGDAVFLPGPLRISKSTAKLGARAAPGSPVAEATSIERQVKVDLDSSQQSDVKVGDKAQITLPDQTTTPGVVSRIGTVAQSGGDDQDGGGSDSDSGAKLPVYVTLKRPKDAGTLDEAPVQVQITTAGVKKALIVPVTALVGKAGGGYTVEKVDARGVHTTVPVELGLFDNAGGQVQVTGDLKAGDQVVVPAT